MYFLRPDNSQRLGFVQRPPSGPRGQRGYEGWSPHPQIREDGERRVWRVEEWIGEGHNPPSEAGYLAADGFTDDISEATDVRGPEGPRGPKGPPGDFKGFQLEGFAEDVDSLPDPTENDGKTWVVRDPDDTNGVVYYALEGEWVDIGPVVALDPGPINSKRLFYDSGFQFPERTIPRETEPNIIHVAVNGSDTREGETRRDAVETLERAIEIAEANPNDRFAVSVHPGGYHTEGNLDVPDNITALFGNHNARSTRIRPAEGYEERSAFRLGNGGYVEGFSFEGGWRTDDLENPTVGVIAFRPGAVIARTVYIHNVSFYRDQHPTLIPPPLDREDGNPLVGNGPCCVLADKSVVSQYSPFPQIMLWGATPVAPNNIGYCSRAGAFINGINAIGLFSHRGFLSLDGGEMILTNCASQFGDWSLEADGARQTVIAFRTNAELAPHENAASAIEANTESLKEQMWDALQSAGFSGSETFTKRDAAFLLEAVAGDMRAGQQEGAMIFTEGLFDWNGVFVGEADNKPYYVLAWETLRDGINDLGISDDAQAMVTGLFDDVVIATLEGDPETRTVPSRVTSLFHQWNNAGTGVNGRALRRPAMSVRDTIRERNLGNVVWNGQDDQRRLYLNDNAIVNGLTGQLEGPAIDRTILPRAARAALIAGGQL